MTVNSSLILQERLNRADRHQQLRHLTPRQGIDFSSNDYLGFSEDPYLRNQVTKQLHRVAIGASGSRLLRGTLPIHEKVEQNLAKFCGTEEALLFPSGYQANLGIFSALLTENDYVFSDQANHASIVDGIRLSRATKFIFPHNDLSTLSEQLRNVPGNNGLKIIATESLFSMDGDFAPLEELADLANKYQALLIVDESHATGIYGDFSNKRGGGLVQKLNLRASVFATIHTGGKALGVGGAWIAGTAPLRDYLINFCRPFIFSTAVTPHFATTLGRAAHYWSEVGVGRATSLLNSARKLFDLLKSQECDLNQFGIVLPKGISPIMPIIVGSNQRAIEISQYLHEIGFDVRAIRPPSVLDGMARLRITVKWNTSESDLNWLCENLTRTLIRGKKE